MIIFGGKSSPIGHFLAPDSKCDYCEQEGSQVISVIGNYAHVFWIPFFPIGRDVFAECMHCKRTLRQTEFSPELKQIYENNKNNVHRPMWHWFGLGLIGFLFVFVFLVGLMT